MTYRFSDVVMATNCSYKRSRRQPRWSSSGRCLCRSQRARSRNLQSRPPNPDLKYGKPYLVGYVGNMSDQEGSGHSSGRRAHIKNSGRRDVHFTCVGGGPGLAGLRKMVKDKKLEDTVNFTGRIPFDDLLEIFPLPMFA